MTTVKISQLPAILGADAATTDVLPIVDVSGNVTNKITREEFFKNIASVDINGGTIDGAVIGGSSAAAGTFTTVTASGDVTIADKIVHSGDTNTAIRFPAADTVTVETSGAERLRVDSSGNVGIGTASVSADPAQRVIEVAASSFGTLRASSSTVIGEVVANSSASRVAVGSASNHPVILMTNNSERMRIDSSGNVGIGTSSPANILTVAKSSADVYSGTTLSPSGVGNSIFVDNTDSTVGSFGQIVFRNGSTGQIFNRIVSVRDAAGQGSLAFVTGSSIAAAERMRIDSSGNVGVGTASPAVRLEASGGIADVIAGTAQVIARSGDNTNFNQIRVRATATESRLESLASGTGTSSPLVIHTGGSERMRIDSSGNLGLGVTPSAWSSSRRAFQVGQSTALYSFSTSQSILGTNVYMDAGGTDRYLNSAAATQYVQSGGAHSWNVAPSGTAGNAITFTQAMTLNASGNLGLGVTSPASKLDVFDGTMAIATRTLVRARDNAQSGSNVLAETKAIQFIGAANTEVGYLSFQHNQGYGELGSVDLAAIGASRPLRFFTNGAERARIDSSGNLLVGTTSGSDRLTVSGNIRVTGVNGNGVSIFTDANSNVLIPRVYSITTSGGVAVFAQSDGRLGPNSSSQKYKTDITSITDVSWLYQLNPVSFYYKDQNGSGQGMLQYGLIAEEVDEVNPDLVHRLDGEVESVHYHKLYAPLLKAIQELKAEVDSLRAQLNP